MRLRPVRNSLPVVLLGVLGNSLDDTSAQLEVFGAPMPGTELWSPSRRRLYMQTTTLTTPSGVRAESGFAPFISAAPAITVEVALSQASVRLCAAPAVLDERETDGFSTGIEFMIESAKALVDASIRPVRLEQQRPRHTSRPLGTRRG